MLDKWIMEKDMELVSWNTEVDECMKVNGKKIFGKELALKNLKMEIFTKAILRMERHKAEAYFIGEMERSMKENFMKAWKKGLAHGSLLNMDLHMLENGNDQGLMDTEYMFLTQTPLLEQNMKENGRMA